MKYLTHSARKFQIPKSLPSEATDTTIPNKTQNGGHVASLGTKSQNSNTNPVRTAVTCGFLALFLALLGPVTPGLASSPAPAPAPAPADAEASYQLGVSLMLQDKHDEAIAHFDKAVALAPDNSEYHRALGDAHGLVAVHASKLHALGHAKKCKAALEKAVALDPNNMQARISLVLFYIHVPGIAGGSDKKGWKQVEEIEKLDPALGWRARVIACMADKRHAEARALLDAKLASDPDCYFTLSQIGRLAYETKTDTDGGIAALQRALQLQLTPDQTSPRHARVQYWLGALHERNKDKSSARAAYEAALALSPGMKEAKTALAKLK